MGIKAGRAVGYWRHAIFLQWKLIFRKAYLEEFCSLIKEQKMEPFIVHYLKDYIKSWKGSEKRFIIEPKNASFSFIECVAENILFGFGEVKWNISAIIPLFSKEKISEEISTVFRKLKGMECRLKWEGFGKRKPNFVLLPIVFKYEIFLPDLKPNLRLIEYLANDKSLLDLIKIIKPDDLFFTLKLGLPKINESFPEFLQRCYNRPEEITWVVTLVRSFPRDEFISYKKLFLAIYELFNTTGDILNKFSKSMLRMIEDVKNRKMILL